jgi:hypothetical protein
MRLNRVSLFAVLALVLSAANLMAQTINIPNQTWTGGPVYISPGGASGFAAPVGQYLVSFGPSASTIGTTKDWSTGPAGRHLHIGIETSVDGGQTWIDGNAGNDFITGQYGKGGAPNAPVINIVDEVPGKTIIVRVSVTVSAPITCGLAATVKVNP